MRTAPSSSPVAARTRHLLEAPILPTLLRLAAPNVVVMAVQAIVSTCEVYFIGWLGAEALAGVAMVYPLIMLMQTMSAGGMGGGVASAVARALGAGRQDDAQALVWHALLIASVMGALFTAGALWGGPVVYRAMGGTGAALQAALAYSNIVFAGACSCWLLNTLASIIRGTGNMVLPASVILGGGAATLLVSPLLIFGWGPITPLGIPGAGVALLTYHTLGSAVLLAALLSKRSLTPLTLASLRWQRALFWDILRVGLPGSLNTVLTNLNVMLLTSLVGHFGTFALAGYGIGARLEYLQIPLVFGFGSALVTMVGTNMGAGRPARARRVAWVGAGLAAAVTGSVGLLAACVPQLWLGLFTTHPEVIQTGTTYLRIVGPTYGCFGLGLALYFASQGAGRLFWPILAGIVRIVLATGGGWLAMRWYAGGLTTLFAALAVALVAYAVIVAGAMHAGAWRTTAQGH